jgi:hypothetical protein
MSTQRFTKMLLGVVAAIVLLGAVLLTGHGRATAQTVTPAPTDPGPLAGYHVPTGPELEPVALARSTASTYARAAGVNGELKVSVVHTTFALAQAITEGKATSEAATGPTSAGIAEWRATPVDVIVMEGTTPDTVFRPNVPHPPGQEPPSGAVLTMILDSHDGSVEGRTLAPSAPSLSALGAVASTSLMPLTVAQIASGKASHSHPAPTPGTLTGKLYFGTRLAKGWQILLSGRGAAPEGRTVVAAKTSAKGTFTIRLDEGRYVISARRPNGKRCAVRKTSISRMETHHIVLRCAA